MTHLDSELDILLRRARAAYDALSPEEKAAHNEEQRRDFAYGNVKLHNPNVTREMVDAAAEKMRGEE